MASIALAASALFAAQSAQAASQTWSGSSTTDGNWSDPANWVGGAPPGSTTVLNNTDIATFNGPSANGSWGISAANPVVIDLPTQNIGGINFDAAAGTYFIGGTGGAPGGNPLLITSGGTIQILSTLTSINAVETINAPLVIEGAAYTFANNSANGTTAAGTGTLNFAGGISGAPSGATTLTLTGTNTNANTISGIVADGAAASLSIAKSGAGTWVLSGPNTFSGTTNITAGNLNIQNNTALGSGTSTVVVNGAGANLQLQGNISVTGRPLSLTPGAAATLPSLENVSGNNSWGGNITVANQTITRIFSDAGSLTLGGNITLNGAAGTGSQLVLQGAGSGTISGIISDSVSGSTAEGLTRSATGAGVWTISGASNYTGPTQITNGALNFQNGTALTTTSQVTVAGGAALQLQGTIVTGTAPLSLSGTGSNVAGATGAFENISGTNSYAGLIGLTGSSTISSDAGSLSLTNTGTITGAGSTLTLAGAGTGSLASIIGTTTGGLVKNGAGTWTVSGASTYTGTTTVSLGALTAGVASVAGASGAFGNNSAVTIANAAGATLNLAGFNTQIASLTGVGTTNGTVTLGGATLTIATNATNSGNFAGVISGTGNLILSGTAGAQTLSGNSTFGGAGNSVTLNSGATLNINSASALGNLANTLVINGGTIDNTSAAIVTIGTYPQIWNGSFTFAGTTHSLITSGPVTLTNSITYTNNGASGALNENGNISGNFVLSKAGTTFLNLGGNNSFAGLNILAGTVVGTSATAFGAGTIKLGDVSGPQNATLNGGFAGTYANPISVTAGNTGTATITNSIATTFGGAITLGNNLVLSPAAFTMGLTGGITGTGNLTLNSTVAAAVITLSNGSVNNTGTITNSGAGAAPNVISAVIGPNVTGVIQNSATSSLSLTGVNTFTSGVSINAGTLSGNNANAFGSGTITLGAATGSANATLSSAFNGTIANPISVTAGNTGTSTITSTAVTTFSGAVTLNNQNLTVSPAASALALTGGVTGTGNLVLNSTGSGVLTISGGSVNDTGTITNSGTGAATNVISAIIGSKVTGIVQNSATSALTLSGANSNFAGPVTISAGTLIAASSTATGSGTVTLNGGTLASNAAGTVPGNVAAGTGAHSIAPGGVASIGTLTIGGNLTTGTNTSLTFDEISPTSGDLLVVNGTINVSSVPTVMLGIAPEQTGFYPLISNSNAAALASVLTLPTAPSNGGRTINYAWDTTHAGFLDLNVTASGTNISSSWTSATTGVQSWTTSGNWTAGVPGIAGDTATFNTSFAVAGQTVQLNGQQQVGALTLNPSGAGVYTIAQATSTDLLVMSNGSSAATLTNTVGNNVISAPLALASNTTITGAAGTLTVSGVVSGPGSLTKTAANTLTLSNANTFTGATSVSGGALIIANANALANTSSITANGGSLELSNNITVPAANPPASITGSGNTSFGVFSNFSGTNTWASNVIVTGGTTSTATTINLTNTTTRIGALGGILTISGVISGNFDVLFRDTSNTAGNGSMVVSGANTYGGATEVGSGLLQLGANNSLPSTTVLNMGLTTVGATNGGIFDLNGFNQALAGLQITTGSDAPSTSPGTTGAVVTNSSTTPITLTFSNSAAESFSNAGSITGNLSLVKLGTATFTLGTVITTPFVGAGVFTYTGSTTVGNGTFALGAAGALPSTTTLNFGATAATSGTGSATSGTLDLHGFSQTVTGLSVVAGSGAANQIINSVSATAGALTVNVPSGTTDTFSGSLGGTGTSNFSLAQSGSGTLTITSGNTYTGGTTISAGTLLAANGPTGSATGTGTVAVQTNGTFGGGASGGSIAGPATVASGGTLQGNSTGALALNSTVTLTSGAAFQFVLNAPNASTAPMIGVPTAGSLTVPAATAVNLVNGGAETLGTYYLIGYGSNADPYTNLALGTLPPGFNYSLIDDTSNQSIDLSVSAVPEPASAALLAVGALGLLARRRRIARTPRSKR